MLLNCWVCSLLFLVPSASAAADEKRSFEVHSRGDMLRREGDSLPGSSLLEIGSAWGQRSHEYQGNGEATSIWLGPTRRSPASYLEENQGADEGVASDKADSELRDGLRATTSEASDLVELLQQSAKSAAGDQARDMKKEIERDILLDLSLRAAQTPPPKHLPEETAQGLKQKVEKDIIEALSRPETGEVSDSASQDLKDGLEGRVLLDLGHGPKRKNLDQPKQPNQTEVENHVMESIEKKMTQSLMAQMSLLNQSFQSLARESQKAVTDQMKNVSDALSEIRSAEKKSEQAALNEVAAVKKRQRQYQLMHGAIVPMKDQFSGEEVQVKRNDIYSAADPPPSADSDDEKDEHDSSLSELNARSVGDDHYREKDFVHPNRWARSKAGHHLAAFVDDLNSADKAADTDGDQEVRRRDANMLLGRREEEELREAELRAPGVQKEARRGSTESGAPMEGDEMVNEMKQQKAMMLEVSKEEADAQKISGSQSLVDAGDKVSQQSKGRVSMEELASDDEKKAEQEAMEDEEAAVGDEHRIASKKIRKNAHHSPINGDELPDEDQEALKEESAALKGQYLSPKNSKPDEKPWYESDSSAEDHQEKDSQQVEALEMHSEAVNKAEQATAKKIREEQAAELKQDMGTKAQTSSTGSSYLNGDTEEMEAKREEAEAMRGEMGSLGGKSQGEDDISDLGENTEDKKNRHRDVMAENEDKMLNDVVGTDVPKPSPSDDVRKMPQDEAKGIADAMKSETTDLQKAHHQEDMGDADVDRMEQEEEKAAEKQ